MKKLLTMLGVVTLTISPAQLLVSCVTGVSALDLPSNPKTQEDIVSLVGEYFDIDSSEMIEKVVYEVENNPVVTDDLIEIFDSIFDENFGKENFDIDIETLRIIKKWKVGQEYLLFVSRIYAIQAKIFQYILSLDEIKRENFKETLIETYDNSLKDEIDSFFKLMTDQTTAVYEKIVKSIIEDTIKFYVGVKFLGSSSTRNKINQVIKWVEKNNFA